jgi:hypothetical protein
MIYTTEYVKVWGTPFIRHLSTLCEYYLQLARSRSFRCWNDRSLRSQLDSAMITRFLIVTLILFILSITLIVRGHGFARSPFLISLGYIAFLSLFMQLGTKQALLPYGFATIPVLALQSTFSSGVELVLVQGPAVFFMGPQTVTYICRLGRVSIYLSTYLRPVSIPIHLPRFGRKKNSTKFHDNTTRNYRNSMDFPMLSNTGPLSSEYLTTHVQANSNMIPRFVTGLLELVRVFFAIAPM